MKGTKIALFLALTVSLNASESFTLLSREGFENTDYFQMARLQPGAFRSGWNSRTYFEVFPGENDTLHYRIGIKPTTQAFPVKVKEKLGLFPDERYPIDSVRIVKSLEDGWFITGYTLGKLPITAWISSRTNEIYKLFGLTARQVVVHGDEVFIMGSDLLPVGAASHCGARPPSPSLQGLWMTWRGVCEATGRGPLRIIAVGPPLAACRFTQ